MKIIKIETCANCPYMNVAEGTVFRLNEKYHCDLAGRWIGENDSMIPNWCQLENA